MGEAGSELLQNSELGPGPGPGSRPPVVPQSGARQGQTWAGACPHRALLTASPLHPTSQKGQMFSLTSTPTGPPSPCPLLCP